MWPLPGYWNEGEASNWVEKCFPQSRCVGGQESVCSEGYIGTCPASFCLALCLWMSVCARLRATGTDACGRMLFVCCGGLADLCRPSTHAQYAHFMRSASLGCCVAHGLAQTVSRHCTFFAQGKSAGAVLQPSTPKGGCVELAVSALKSLSHSKHAGKTEAPRALPRPPTYVSTPAGVRPLLVNRSFPCRSTAKPLAWQRHRREASDDYVRHGGRLRSRFQRAYVCRK
jgi:hypothetical protein